MSKPSPKIVIRGMFVPHAAYGMIAQYFAESLLDLGYKVKCNAIAMLESFGATIPQRIKDNICYGPLDAENELVLSIPGFPHSVREQKYQGKRILFTMWETTRFPKDWIEDINKCHAIIVPNEWNKEMFIANEVTCPIYIVPLYITNDYYPAKTFPKMTVFGAAGNMSHGGIRKGMDEILAAFQLAFPVESDVFLKIKIFPSCNLRPVFDSRIQVIRAYLDNASMREWYQSLSAFISASRGEGWNLHMHEAMACGKPAIACNFSGHTTFFRPDHNGYVIDHQMVVPLAVEYYETGLWADPSVESLAKRMREVYENPAEAFYRGMNATKSVAEYTPKNSLDRLIEVLQTLEII